MAIFSYKVFTKFFFFKFQDLQNIPETNTKARQSDGQKKKQLNKSVRNDEQHENKELQGKAEKFEHIVRNKNRNIIWLACHQGKVFECLISVWSHFCSIGYLQPALPHRNISNDITNV